MASSVPTLAASAFGALLLVVPNAHAGGSDPQVVLDEIFGQMDAMCGGDGNGPAYDLNAIANTYFTPELEKTFEKAMASDDFGFDILIDAQDCRTTDLELAIVDSSDSGATGRATFKNMGEERIIDLVMTKSGEEWKVSDVVYRHRPFSLLARE